jgi:hypothetical protein
MPLKWWLTLDPIPRLLKSVRQNKEDAGGRNPYVGRGRGRPRIRLWIATIVSAGPQRCLHLPG